MNRLLLVSMISLTALEAASTALPPYTRETLPNGAVVYLMPRRDLPMITFRALVRGGSEADPEGKAGLGAMTAELVTRGTAKRSADEFAEALEFFGTSLNTFYSRQSSSLSMETLAVNWQKTLDLMLEALLSPALSEDEFTKLAARYKDQARQVKDNPQAAIPGYYNALIFGPSHPYSRTPDEISAGNIRHGDVKEFYGRMYVASNLTFIAVGDFDPAAMKSLLASSLGRMGKGEPHGWKTAARPAGPSRLLLVNKPDATQTYFEIGHAGVDRKHPDRTAIQVVNTLFGGRFTSMLNDALRVNAGLTYGARSGFDNDRLTGAFRISSYTRTAATVQAIDMALDLLRKLREQGISAGQLQSAKAYLKGMYPTRTMETAGQLAGVLADIETFGLSRGEFDDYFARVDAVTLDQANAAAKKYFGSEPLRFVLLGNAGAIRDQVKKYAPEMAEIEVTAPGYPVAR